MNPRTSTRGNDAPQNKGRGDRDRLRHLAQRRADARGQDNDDVQPDKRRTSTRENLKARPVRLPRHTWILETIHEKISRERRKG